MYLVTWTIYFQDNKTYTSFKYTNSLETAENIRKKVTSSAAVLGVSHMMEVVITEEE